MKSMLLLVVTTFLMAMAVGTASAQVVDPVSADIPFSFTVRQTTLPAGHYTMKRLGSDPEVMEIIGEDYKNPVLVLVEEAQVSRAPRKGEVIFDRVGDQYFLSKIFEEGNSYGVEVPKSRRERGLEKEGMKVQAHSISIPTLIGKR